MSSFVSDADSLYGSENMKGAGLSNSQTSISSVGSLLRIDDTD